MRSNRIARRALGALALVSGFLSLQAFAETPASPAALAETARLNRDISAANAAADTHYEALMKQYREQKGQNDQQQKRYQEELKHNSLLQQQYQQKLHDYQRKWSSKS